MSGVKAVGLVSAAGLSSRMGMFKPFLDVDGKPLIARTVESLLDGGAEKVIVVTGRNSEQVAKVLSIYPQVQTVYNEHYAETAMYDSIRLGMQQINGCDVILFLPADVPAVRPETIRNLLQCWEKNRPDVLYPVYQGRQWHPPLIAGRLLPALTGYNGENGLKGALQSLCSSSETVLVPDRGCTMDTDYVEDYQNLCRYWSVRDIPDDEGCDVLYKLAGTPDEVQSHCRMVAEKAIDLAGIVEQQGVMLNRDLLYRAALLHDVCRTEKNHAEAGADFLKSYGFYRIADIVQVHMEWPDDKPLQLDEAAVLYLADKLISGKQDVSLAQRFAEKLERYHNQPEIAEKIKKRQRTALAIQNMIAAKL